MTAKISPGGTFSGLLALNLSEIVGIQFVFWGMFLAPFLLTPIIAAASILLLLISGFSSTF